MNRVQRKVDTRAFLNFKGIYSQSKIEKQKKNEQN